MPATVYLPLPTVIIQYLSDQSALIIRIQDFTYLDPDLSFKAYNSFKLNLRETNTDV